MAAYGRWILLLGAELTAQHVDRQPVRVGLKLWPHFAS